MMEFRISPVFALPSTACDLTVMRNSNGHPVQVAESKVGMVASWPYLPKKKERERELLLVIVASATVVFDRLPLLQLNLNLRA